MPEAVRAVQQPPRTTATIFNRLLLGKQTPRTREAYAADLRAFARFLGLKSYQDVHPLAAVPDTQWQRLDPAHVAAYIEHLKRTNRPKTGQPYSTATIARRLTAARGHGIYLAVGVIERAGGTLYCTLLYFGPDGVLLGKHRKLKPTGSERLIWGEGDGRGLITLNTELGVIGGLICWENYMPLARMALYQQGVQLYLAPTADARDTWQATVQHIACEGRCFVLGCNQYVTKRMYPPDLRDELAEQPEVMCRGGSAVISPFGEVLAGPLYGEEGILTAALDLGEVIRGKYDFDVAGHYHRSDVFHFEVRD